jgi:hypothetical protein
MSKHWIVVADQSRARIFTVDDPHGESQELEHPVGRDQAHTLGSDRPGRSFERSARFIDGCDCYRDRKEPGAV